MKKILIFAACALLGATGAAGVPGTPRDSNIQLTEGYAPTRVEAKLLIPVEKNTRTLHFIRDNNDPRVITKSYLLKHADAYEIRDCLREMVQSKRVGNTSLLQNYPGSPPPPAALGTHPAPPVWRCLGLR